MESPVSSLLRTNSVPSTPQQAAIRDFLSSCQPELARLEEEVSRLQDLLSVATAARDAHKALMDDHQALLSPVRRVPDDILRAIFVATLHPTRDTALSGDEGPLLVAQICKFWREIALTTPRLWASMHLSIPGDDSQLRSAMIEVVATWLKRSGAVPLSFTIMNSRGFYDPFSGSEAVLKLLTSVAGRWGSLRIVPMVAVSLIPHLRDLTAEDVPLLEGLSTASFFPLAPPGAPQPEPQSAPPCELTGAPNLKRLFFSGPPSSLSPNTPWATIRRFNLSAPYGAMDESETFLFPLHILQHCSLLEDFYFWSNDIPVSFPAEPQHLTIPKLSTLSVYGLKAEQWPELLARVQMPEFRSLALLSAAIDYTWLLDANLRLKTLQIMDSAVRTDLLLDILRAQPELEELSLGYEPVLFLHNYDDADDADGDVPIHGDNRDARFLEWLIPSEDDAGVICPHLLRLRLFNFYTLSDALILAFLRSRTLLTHASFSLLRPRQLDVAAELGDETTRGLRLSTVYTEGSLMHRYSPRAGIYDGDGSDGGFTFRRSGTAF
ncbi:F-box domain-containing protein [Mycena kentingensis (nom. inval.)]|nr:F-box domain-containing protein [Mycena kentingensis (nom. inval.)]